MYKFTLTFLEQSIHTNDINSNVTLSVLSFQTFTVERSYETHLRTITCIMTSERTLKGNTFQRSFKGWKKSVRRPEANWADDIVAITDRTCVSYKKKQDKTRRETRKERHMPSRGLENGA